MATRATGATRATNIVLGLAASALAVEVFAAINVALEQRRRAYLGDKLYVDDFGDGDPVVFLAGLQGSTRYWRDCAPFADRNRLLMLDALGFGRSPWPHHEPTLEDHLGAIRRTLVDRGATKNVTIVAHSMGTILAAYYAARFADEVTRLVLLGAPVYDDREEAERRIGEMSHMAKLFALQPILARAGCDLVCAMRPILKRVLPRLMNVPAPVAADSVLHHWPSFHGTMENVLLRSPIAPPLREVGEKTTLVHGIRDHVTPLARVEKLARDVGARFVEVDSDHQGYIASLESVLCAELPSS